MEATHMEMEREFYFTVVLEWAIRKGLVDRSKSEGDAPYPDMGSFAGRQLVTQWRETGRDEYQNT